MNVAHEILIASALAATLAVDAARPLEAAELSSALTMKPLHGLSFDIGSRHAVGYFEAESGQCKLVLTLAEAPDWNDVPSLAATRFEAAIPGGKATRFNASEGKALEFGCNAGASAMSVTGIEEVAVNALR
jgi:hypothetical protein